MGLLVDTNPRVVAYYRHSREHAQENSIPIQRERIAQFAVVNHLDIVHELSDESSGLTIEKRDGFLSLLHDWVFNDERAKGFEGIIFLDVSRMGRFQDLDEHGYYSYMIRQRGKWLWFLEQGNITEEQNPMQQMMIFMKRAAAAEQSAKLSDRVWHGSKHISAQGYSVGGTACYGLERILLNEQRHFVCVLNKGEHKQVSNQRVSFRPKNDATTDTVRDIFRQFVTLERSPSEIAGRLNRQEVLSPAGAAWNRSKVMRLLQNEVYIGTRIYNRTWQRLSKKQCRNPRRLWVICPKAFPATVAPDVFFAAQKRLELFLPSLRYRGKRFIRAIERGVMTEIIKAMYTSNLLTPDDPETGVVFPLVFAIRQDRQPEPHWSFSIPESLRPFEYVVCVGLAFDEVDAIKRFFVVPTADFGTFNVLTISENSEADRRYTVEKIQAKETLLASLRREPSKTIPASM